ncbi:MAG: LysR substrate-binding domain-containing protein [Methylacidiphilales bacterium]|nr:LysR substrate-binding domain-containing protein [Candidatus Methylacidiphilales bacterium]
MRHLRYFVVVAEEQNVTRAAERLHLSQPPLSRQIRDLEEELGVELFRRTAKSLALTEAGKIFLAEARAVLLRAEQAVQTVSAMAKGERGHLRVGYAPSLTVEFLPRALKLFEPENLGVKISLHDLSTEECTQRLKGRKLDVALIVRPLGRALRGLTFEKVAEYPFYVAVAVSHPFARKRLVSPAQLKNERLMAYNREDYPEQAELLQQLFAPYGFEPQLADECDSATSLIAAVEAGRGVALVASSMRCLAGPRLKFLPLKPKLPPITVGALFLKPAGRWVEPFIAAAKKAAASSAIKW